MLSNLNTNMKILIGISSITILGIIYAFIKNMFKPKNKMIEGNPNNQNNQNNQNAGAQNTNNPNTNNNNVTITVIKINGINTINHDIILKPKLHKIFNIIVNIIITINFNKATLYNFLKISIIICTNEKPIYNIAGPHKFNILYYYIIF